MPSAVLSESQRLTVSQHSYCLGHYAARPRPTHLERSEVLEGGFAVFRRPCGTAEGPDINGDIGLSVDAKPVFQVRCAPFSLTIDITSHTSIRIRCLVTSPTHPFGKRVGRAMCVTRNFTPHTRGSVRSSEKEV